MEEIEEYLAGEDWSENTVARYRRAIRQFLAEIKQPQSMKPAGFKKWLKSHPWGASAQWVAYSAVRGWLRWKYGDDHPALMLKLKRQKSPPQRTLDFDQVRKLLFSFDTQSVKGRRDLAMACLFLDSGLRVSEMCSLATRYLQIEHLSLTVQIKGGSWEAAVYSPYTASCLASWLADRERLVKPGVGQVFVGVGGLTPGREMTRHGLQRVVEYWGKAAGIGKLSPHDFRRTFATLATRLGAPVKVVMAGGRWSSEMMVNHYARAIGPEDMAPYSPVMHVVR